MGQCSTLPEARAPSSSTARHEGAGGRGSRKSLRDEGRTEGMDFNKLTTDETARSPDHRKNSSSLHVTVPDTMHDTDHAQARDPDQSHVPSRGVVPEPMDVDHREGSNAVNLPPPPEAAVRTRCYKLNLDSDIGGLHGKQHSHQLFLGPFAEPPPHLTYSKSDDSATTNSATTVAIQTAQIFRGITVGKDGTILSQNARATRSNRGSKTKKGEKSRQAAKIDKAKDLVEEAVLGSKNNDSEPVNMVSLVIVGAYDDMKHLVRDGSKKLREAEGLPDEALLSINRHRANSAIDVPTSPMHRVQSSHSHRSHQAHGSSSKRSSSMHTPDKSRSTGLPQSAPPKIKSNPRDRTKSRRHSEEKSSRRGFVTDSCNDMLDNGQQGNLDGDWRDALGFSKGFHSIWNCGGVEEGGTVSPTQVCSPKEGKSHGMEMAHHNPVFEGRDTALGYGREGENSRRT